MIALVIAIFLVVFLIYFFNSYQNKYQSFQGMVFNILIVSLIVFLLVSIGYVYTQSNPQIGSFDDALGFARVYFVWVGGFFGQVGHSVGYVVKQDWGANITEVPKK